MQPLQIVRYGAYGDLILASSTFPFLQKLHSPINIETNLNGASLFAGDTRFKTVSIWTPDTEDEIIFYNQCVDRWRSIEDDCIASGTKYLNFWSAIENKCSLHEFSQDAKLDRNEIAEKCKKNYYESHFEIAEITMPVGWFHSNTINFSKPEYNVCERWAERNHDHFKMMVAIGGSSRQKVFPTWMRSYCESLIDQYPKLKIYLMGGSELAKDVWEYERTFSYVNGTGTDISYKQAVLMTKYSDYVLGGETGLMIGAGMMGTPKTTLFTLGAKDQIVNYHLNDYSVQSKASCSPCYIMAYSGTICPTEPVYNAFPICTHEFDLNELANIFDKLYTARF